MITLPEVGGLIRPTAVRNVDLPAARPDSATTSRAGQKSDISHGDHLGVAAAIDLGQAMGFYGCIVGVHDGIARSNASLGSTQGFLDPQQAGCLSCCSDKYYI